MKDWTIEHLDKLKAGGWIIDYTVMNPDHGAAWQMIARAKAGDKAIKIRAGKYNSVKTVVDGITFDSAKEAGRYSRLKMLLDAKLIEDLRLQVPYELNEGGAFSFVYEADFVYIDKMTSETIVEDAKGYRTKEYKKKRKLMWKIHGIKILET